MNILSVDWDFFFPDVIPLDWGHKESPLFIESLWPIRAGNRNLLTKEKAIDTILPDKNLLNGFWERVIYQPGLVYSLIITESHADISIILKEDKKNVVVNFDQHHDILYRGRTIPKGDIPDCDYWAGWGIKYGYIKELHQFYPEWRKQNPESSDVNNLLPELNTKRKHKITVNYGLSSNYLPKIFGVVFICRSGAWTPSWCDDKWLEFISWWKKFPSIWDNKIILPYVLQERKPNLEEAIELSKQWDKQYEEVMKWNQRS